MAKESSNIYVNIDDLRKLQHQARGFSFLANQPVNSALSGKNASRLRGRGLNFEELRHYRPGDDIRSMDWKVTRRTGKPHIKVYTEERERNVFLVVSQSKTMFFGSENKMKSVIAAEISALIAWQITNAGDRVGAIVFNENDVKVVPAKRGRQHVVNILTEIVKKNHQLKAGEQIDGSAQSINNALAKLTQICGHNALIIIVGDGQNWDQEASSKVKKLRQHNEVIAVRVSDPLEEKLPKMGQMVVSDGEFQIQFSSKDAKTQMKFQDHIEQQLDTFSTAARKNRIPLINIDTIEPVQNQMRRELGKIG